MLADGSEGGPVSVSAITSKWRCNIPIQQIQGMTPVSLGVNSIVFTPTRRGAVVAA